MAPEQRQPGRKTDHRVDLYALGVVASELFADPSVAECATGHGDRTIGKPFAALVQRASEEDPARRFQTAEEFQEALTKHQRVNERRQKPKTTSTLAAAVALALALGIGLVAVGLWPRGGANLRDVNRLDHRGAARPPGPDPGLDLVTRIIVARQSPRGSNEPLDDFVLAVRGLDSDALQHVIDLVGGEATADEKLQGPLRLLFRRWG